jgi:cytochrome c-type biogenesis protein CcmH/NrfF
MKTDPVKRAIARRSALVLLAVLGLCVVSAAAEPPDQQKVRARRIEDAVLAPCCYAEPASRHQSEIAVKMRVEIAKWVAAGKTDAEIMDAYVQQYGSKVLVDPRTIPGWWTPWVPWLAVIFGVVFALWLLRRWRSHPAPAESPLPSLDVRALPDFDDEE